MKVLITGATGSIGREVGKLLVSKGHEVLILSRNAESARRVIDFPCEIIEGDLGRGDIVDARLATVEGVINLIGASVMGRWSESKKKEIYDSRILSTRHLIHALSKNLKVFVAGSAMGFYGDRGDEMMVEGDPVASDFMAQVCKDWEAEAALAPGRKVFVRTGIVLSKGGALGMMLPFFRLCLGGTLGRGRHWMSWIHIEDIARLFVFALENAHVEGPINGAAPHPVTNKEFTKELVRALGVIQGPPVPPLALKLLFGEMGSVVLTSMRSSNKKVEGLGFEFKYPVLREALENLPFIKKRKK